MTATELIGLESYIINQILLVNKLEEFSYLIE